MQINLVVFDLDGTLVKSHETIYKATLHVLNELNISSEMPEEKFCTRIGLHFEDIFREFGIVVPDFEKFIRIYKAVYFDFMNHSELYEGVNEILDHIKSQNLMTALLTTKAQDQAERIIDYFALRNKFNLIMGRRPGIAHKPSAEPLFKICEELKTSVEETLIVGDSELDVQCGKNAGSKTCAVTFGYREKEDLQKQYPDFLIDNLLELQYIIDKKKR